MKPNPPAPLCKGGRSRFFPHAKSRPAWPWKLTALAFLSLLQFLAACGERPPEIERRSQFLMGTLAEISVRGPDRAKARDAMTLAFHEIARIEKMMSHRLPGSELSRLNREAGKDFMPVSEELLEVVREGIRWGELSGGALDIAIGPVADLWDFDEEKKQIPEPGRLKQAVELSRYQDIQIRGREMRLARPGMAINLGSIAKGYAVD
ncbi:MAG: FAD:protein FMN transferase, partial [Nitrospinae bacterium]|nr:FAD:protein FMN transferase [Nitrospinota bacterium]